MKDERSEMKAEMPGVANATETQETPEIQHSEPEAGGVAQQPDEGTARVERLLRHASSWNPETSAPEDLARQALVNRGLLRGGKARGSVRTQPWWGMSTVGLTAAAAVLLYVQGALPMVNAPDHRSPLSTYLPISDGSYGFSTGMGLTERLVKDSTQIAATNASLLYAASERNREEGRDREKPSAEVKPVQYQSKESPTNGSWRVRAQRPRPMPAVAAETNSQQTTEKPPVVRWEVEAPPSPSYRMYVPVVMTDEAPQDGDGSGEITGTPGVMEVAFDPSVLMPPPDQQP